MGRQARLKQQRRSEREATPRPLKPQVAKFAIADEDDLEFEEFEMEQEMFQVALPNQPPRTLTFWAGTVPCTPKLFFKEFDPDWLRQAVLEYWQTHDFNWMEWRKPNAPILTGRVPMVDQELPGDMASALSLEAFAQRYRSTTPEETQVRQFCIVVCGLGKAMQMVQQQWRKLEPAALYEVALQITQCQTVS